MKQTMLFFLLLVLASTAIAQKTTVEGYTFEDGNRGFLNQVKVTIYSLPENGVQAELFTDMDGKFAYDLQRGQRYRLNFNKDIFHDYNDTIELGIEKMFRKISMKRKPGYVFEVTLAESRINENQIVDAISGTRIDVYNNTTKKVEWAEEYHESSFFKHNFEQGNHYTLLFRKQGYENRQIEAHVNIDGCIICIEGVSQLRPGVVDNLTANNTMGTLLANIDMKRMNNYKASGLHDTVWVKTLPSLEEMVREKEMEKAIQQLGNQKEVKIEQKIVVEPSASPAPRREQVQLPEANNSVKLPKKEKAVEVTAEITAEQSTKMIPINVEKETEQITTENTTQVLNEATDVETIDMEEEKATADTPAQANHQNSKFLTPLPDNFTAYTIEIGAFETPIDSQNQHFKKSGQLYYKQEADGKYYYYSGNAASPQRIVSYFDAVVKPRFENARICLFKDGVKTYVN